MMVPAKLARFAERYCERGLALVPTPPGQKGPRHLGWNRTENAITNPAAAFERWSANPRDGVAALLAPSGLVSIDIDDEALADGVLRHFGVHLNRLREDAPCVVGRHYQLIFAAPAEPVSHRSVAWPKKDDPRKRSVLFELRAGNITTTLPPTIHPGTGRPYRWENPPSNGFPPLPPRLLELWSDWPTFNRQALALCPWAPPPKEPPPPRPRTTVRSGPSVIHEFNAAHEVSAILEAHGYQRRGRRFASPDTQHSAGVSILDDGRVYCHHQGDPLSGEHAHDAFDVFRILDHGGDFRSAVRAAAQVQGMVTA